LPEKSGKVSFIQEIDWKDCLQSGNGLRTKLMANVFKLNKEGWSALPAQQSSSVPDGPLQTSIRRCLSSTATFCQ